MAKKLWSFTIENQRHTVDLEHRYGSGKRVIAVDGQIIHESSKLLDTGSEHEFQIEGHPCVLKIRTNGLWFNYEFVLDGYPIEPGHETSFSVTADGSELISSENLERRSAHHDLVDQLNRGVRSWGIFSILLGVIHLLSSGLLNATWGILLILVGLISFIFRSASMYVIYAVVIAWAGMQNLLLGGTEWMLFSAIQLFLTIQVVRQYVMFRKAGLVKNEELERQGLVHFSRAERLFPWSSCSLGGLAVLAFVGLFVGLVIYASINPNRDQIPYETSINFGFNMAINAGVLALGLGLAAALSRYRHRLLSIIGSLAGVLVIVLNLLFYFLS